MFSERKMGTPARLMASKSVKSDAPDKSQNLKNSRRANATIIKLMVDSCTNKFLFSTFVGRVKSDQPTIKTTNPCGLGFRRFSNQGYLQMVALIIAKLLYEIRNKPSANRFAFNEFFGQTFHQVPGLVIR